MQPRAQAAPHRDVARQARDTCDVRRVMRRAPRAPHDPWDMCKPFTCKAFGANTKRIYRLAWLLQ